MEAGNIFSIFKKGDKLAPEEKLNKDEIEERREVVDFVRDQYATHPLKGEELLKRAYYKAWVDGYHYMNYDVPKNKLYKVVPTASEKHRSKINYVGKNQSIAVAKILKDSPTLIALPMSSSMGDIKSARIANAIFQNALSQNEVDLTGKTFDVMKVANSYGTGWWKIPWNPLLKPGKGGKPMGDYQVTVHDDFEVFPDPSARDWWTMEWYIHAYLQDIAKLERLYPKMKGKIKPWVNNESEQSRNIYTSDYYSQSSKCFEGKAFVLEFLARPGGKWERGKKVILINQELLAKYGDNPYMQKGKEYGEFAMDMVPFVWDSEVGKLHGRSGVVDEIPINKEIDKICSMTMENIKKTAAMKVLLPNGSQKPTDFISDKVHFVMYNPDNGGKPIFPDPPSMPSYVPNHLMFLIGAQKDMAGVHEVSEGQLPERGSQMSGSALKLLQDSEMVQHSPVMRRLKISMGIAGQLILKHVQNHYTEPRLLTLTGPHKRHEVIEFLGSDLNGSVDIKLEIGSAFNTSAAAKIEGILSLFKEGVLQEAEKGSKAARKVLESLEFGQVDEIYQMEGLQEARVQWVIDRILKDHKVPDVYDWENHDVYIQSLQELMLNPDFQEKEDDVKKIFNDQMAYHQQMKAMPAPAVPPNSAGGSPTGTVDVPTQAAEQNMSLAQGSNMPVDGTVAFPEEGVVNA
jgi:hypothetical protein